MAEGKANTIYDDNVAHADMQVHFEEDNRDVRITVTGPDTHKGKSPLHDKTECCLPVTNALIGSQPKA